MTTQNNIIIKVYNHHDTCLSSSDFCLNVDSKVFVLTPFVFLKIILIKLTKLCMNLGIIANVKLIKKKDCNN